MARRRIKVAEFRGEPVDLEFHDGSVYPVRGDMLVDVVLLMTELEEQGAEIGEDGEAAGEFAGWLTRAQGLLLGLVTELTPDAVLPLLSVEEILGTFGALMGGESVSQAVVEALQAGMSEARGLSGEDVEESPELVEGGKDGGEPETPLRSGKPSSSASGTSRSDTDGNRDGGGAARGRSSASSSRSQTKARAA